jgi:hypothetical protein
MSTVIRKAPGLGEMDAHLLSALVPFICPETKPIGIIKSAEYDKLSPESRDYFAFAHQQAEQLYSVYNLSKVNKSFYQAFKTERIQLQNIVASAILNIYNKVPKDIFMSVHSSYNLLALRIFYWVQPQKLIDCDVATKQNILHAAGAPDHGTPINCDFIDYLLYLCEKHKLCLCQQEDKRKLTPFATNHQYSKLGGTAVVSRGNLIPSGKVAELFLEHAKTCPKAERKEEKRS